MNKYFETVDYSIYVVDSIVCPTYMHMITGLHKTVNNAAKNKLTDKHSLSNIKLYFEFCNRIG